MAATQSSHFGKPTVGAAVCICIRLAVLWSNSSSSCPDEATTGRSLQALWISQELLTATRTIYLRCLDPGRALLHSQSAAVAQREFR